MHGVHGRALHVELPRGVAAPIDIPEIVSQRMIGGSGLAAWLLYRWCPAGVDPLAPGNPLIFASSPFIGTGITTASKIALATKSPQTGMIGDSLSSSYLAIALKRTGFDALVITGRASEPSVLVVTDDRVELRPAAHLLGMTPAETSRALRQALGDGYRVAAIGLAGERGVRYAAVSNDGRLAGRTGTGAVMGSKNLKAIAIRGSRLPAVADPRGLGRAARELAQRSLGPATAKYREIGTVANVAFFDRIGILPTRNFQAGSFEGSAAISGEALTLEHRADTHACAACTVGCEHHFALREGDDAGRSVRAEYESLFALGSLCGIDDPDTVLRAAALCDDYGIEAISTGGTIAWAMECAERGVDLDVPADEMPRFGDRQSLLRTIRLIGARRPGLGALLAEGSRRAAARTGQGSQAWAMHVKGLEMPGYHPRKLRTLALGLAVATRGACHNRSSAYEVDLSDRLDPAAEARARATAAAAAEDQAALLDSLTLCKFLRHCFEDLYAESAALYSLVTGVPTTAADLRAAAERVNNLKKLFNIREGWTRDDDRLPPRALEGEGGLDSAAVDDLISAYYAVRGWDEDGRVSTDHLRRIGLADVLVLAAGRA